MGGGWSAGSRKHGEYLERTRKEEAVTIRPEGEAQAPRTPAQGTPHEKMWSEVELRTRGTRIGSEEKKPGRRWWVKFPA